MDRNLFQQLLGELTPAIRSYLFPGYTAPEAELDALSEAASDAAPEEYLAEEPDEYCLELPAPAVKVPKISFFRKVGITSSVENRCPAVENRAPAAAGGTTAATELLPFPVVDPLAEEKELDPNTKEILAEIRRIQEKYGVTLDELELIMGYTVRLSPVHITLGGQIFLPDFEHKEVKMSNISKALYFLFLRHPEGLRYKEVADHREELLNLYLRVTGRDDPEEIEKSIDLLIDPYGNALNVNASRIKTAFRNVVSDRVARFYYLNGAAGDVKKVPLDRDLVIWEH